MKEKDFRDDSFKSALIKRALGYDSEEVIEEYSKCDDGVVLTKKKVTRKNVPPDVTALKILLEIDTEKLSLMTDEELEREKERLLKELSELQKKEEKNCKKKTSNKKSKKVLKKN